MANKWLFLYIHLYNHFCRRIPTCWLARSQGMHSFEAFDRNCENAPRTAGPLHALLTRIQEWAHSPRHAGYDHFKSLYLLERPKIQHFILSLDHYEAMKVEFSSVLTHLWTNCQIKSFTYFYWACVLVEHICERCRITGVLMICHCINQNGAP